MRDFPEVGQDGESSGLVIKDRTGELWLVKMDWSGPYPIIMNTTQASIIKETLVFGDAK